MKLYESADKAFKEMLDISTDIDKAILYTGQTVIASNFPESLNAVMIAKGQQLAAMGDFARATDMKSALTQLVVDAGQSWHGVLRAGSRGRWIGRSDHRQERQPYRFGLYDMKTHARR